MKRIFFYKILFFIILNAAISMLAYADHGVEGRMVDKDEFKVSFNGEPFGNDNTAWNISLQFSPYGSVGRILVVSRQSIPSLENSIITITFNTAPKKTTLTIPCTKYDGTGVNFALCQGILRPSSTDYMNTPLSDIECENMAAFIAFKISSIKINGFLLPGPYPTQQEFMKMFDLGASKYPSYYTRYNQNRKGKSTSSSGKSSKGSETGKSGKTTNVTPPKPKRPAAIPDGIEIEAYNVQMPFSGVNNNSIKIKKKGQINKDMGILSIEDQLKYPLGIKGMTWTGNVSSMLKEAEKTNLWFDGYYNVIDKYDDIMTDLNFRYTMYLPGSFYYNSQELRFKANFTPQMLRIIENNRSICPLMMHSRIIFNLVYNSYPVDHSSKKDMKKFNKAFLKYYHDFIESLRAKGYELKRDKDSVSKERYSVYLHDGKRLTLDIQLWKIGNINNDYISIDISDSKVSK